MAIAKISTYDELSWYEIYNIFVELFLTSFRYENLPEGLNSRFMEQSLMQNGQCGFFHDPDVDRYLALKCVSMGGLNVYFEPIKIQLYGGGGYQKVRTVDVDSVLMYNNYSRTSPIPRLQRYAQRIAAIENTSDININAQKTPYIIKTSKDRLHTMKQIYTQMDTFQPAIIVDKDMDMNAIAVLPTVAPYVVDKLDDFKRKLMNEALSFIGIENNSSEKSERLLRDEIMVSNGLAIANRNARLMARKDAITKINKMFGLDIEVFYNNPSFSLDGNNDNIEDNSGAEMSEVVTNE
jgi:hypothetical protein